jgi:hypothetical protein
MKPLPKLLLGLSVPVLVLRLVVRFSCIKFAPDWTLARPVGLTLPGLFLISRFGQDEVAKFDAEQQLQSDPASRPGSSSAAKGDERAQEAQHARIFSASHSG